MIRTPAFGRTVVPPCLSPTASYLLGVGRLCAPFSTTGTARWWVLRDVRGWGGRGLSESEFAHRSARDKRELQALNSVFHTHKHTSTRTHSNLCEQRAHLVLQFVRDQYAHKTRACDFVISSHLNSNIFEIFRWTAAHVSSDSLTVL